MKMYVNTCVDLYYFIKNRCVMCNDGPKVDGAIVSLFSVEDFNRYIEQGRFTEVPEQGRFTEVPEQKSNKELWTQVALVATIVVVAVGVIFL